MFFSRKLFFLAVLVFFLLVRVASAQSLPVEVEKQIDEIVTRTLAAGGTPSASLAVVQDGQIAYLHAYGQARLEPSMAARPEMRYPIGSISKQFTAAAILMLEQHGKLSLDDPVSKFIPDLTRAGEVTLRELLSQTSGYQDYWPQDYVPPAMLKPVTAQDILNRWARIPLDFAPGTRWQYSNTNYVIAGLIAEKAGGEPLMRLLHERVFAPLRMGSVLTVEQDKAMDSEPSGYLRYALGPPRPAPREGAGWLFAAAELAMTASDLARWDISMIDETVLQPASYRQMETEVLLKNGVGTGYGLGLDVGRSGGRRMLAHGGEVSGFVARNVVFPDDRAAIVVLTNLDASSAAEQIADQIQPLLFPVEGRDMAARLATARRVLAQLQHGRIERSLFTADGNSYFSDQAVRDFASSLGPLGAPLEFRQTRYGLRGGMDVRVYSVKFKTKTVRITMRDMPGGKIEQFQVAPLN